MLQVQPVNDNVVLLDEHGGTYQLQGDDLVAISQDSVAGLAKIASDPYRHFFKTPYFSAVYAVDGQTRGSIKIHPSSFYPGSPFDTFNAIDRYYNEGVLAIPRFYFYPSGICRSHCPICQFYELDRFKGRSAHDRIIPYETASHIIDEMRQMGQGLKSLSAIVSGDGEPPDHPDITKILDKFGENGIRVFLGSSLRLPRDSGGNVLRAIARNISMVTVSVKGLGPTAYDKYQGTRGGTEFENVMRNVEKLVRDLERTGRRKDVLVGVATLVLPENTDHYGLTQRFIDMGVDYLYINPVEPSCKQWGIEFTEGEQRKTHEFLGSLGSMNCGSTMVRYPGNLRLNEPEKSVYVNASSLRKNPEICGSAIWNPTIITTDTPGATGARVLSCRSSQNFGNSEFWYADGWQAGNRRFSEMVKSGLPRVMSASTGCTACRLERQVGMFDQTLSLMKENSFKGRFLLSFEVGDLHAKGKAIPFEQTK